MLQRLLVVTVLISATTPARAQGNDCRIPPGRWVPLATAAAPGQPVATAAAPGQPAPPPVVEPASNVWGAWTAAGWVVFNTAGGAVLDACANRWRSASPMGRPSASLGDAVSSRMIVAGTRIVFLQQDDSAPIGDPSARMTARIYDAASNRWTNVPQSDAAPLRRRGAAIAWSGQEVIVWGGVVDRRVPGGEVAQMLGDGARLDPAAGRWRPIASAGAPSPRSHAAHVWTGGRLWIWGGARSQRNAYLPLPNIGHPNERVKSRTT